MDHKLDSCVDNKIKSENDIFKNYYYLNQIEGLQSPVIVSEMYEVGEKTKIANLVKNHLNIGIDCAANCLNEIVSLKAKPLFFSANILWERRNEEILDEINKGIKYICDKTDTKFFDLKLYEASELIKTGSYILAGFCVGAVNKDRIFDQKEIEIGDVIIGLTSSGIHNLGFSQLVKNIRPSNGNLNEYIEKFKTTLGEELIKPTKCYVNSVLFLEEQIKLKAVINISKKGLFTSINNILPKDLHFNINIDSFPKLPVFSFISSVVNYNEELMLQNYNMGIGMVLIVSDKDKDEAISILKSINEEVYIIGKIENKNY